MARTMTAAIAEDPREAAQGPSAWSAPPAAFNASHWSAVDAAVETLETIGAPTLLAAELGSGAEAVVMAALETAARAEPGERRDAVESCVWIAPERSDLTAALDSLGAALDARPDADALALEARRAAAEQPFALILRLPHGRSPTIDFARFLDRLAAPARGAEEAALRLIVIADPEACAALAASAPALRAPERRVALRPHDPDETRAWLRIRIAAAAAADQAALSAAARVAQEATAGSPELLERFAAELPSAPNAPFDVETALGAVERAGLASDPELVGLAETARGAAERREECGERPLSADADAAEDAAAAPTEPAGEPRPGGAPDAPGGRSPQADALSLRARGRLHRRSRRRQALVALGYAAALSLAGLLVLTGASEDGRDPLSRALGVDLGAEGREALLDVADGVLVVTGAAADALAEHGPDAVAEALDDVASGAQSVRGELDRGRFAGELSELSSDQAGAEREAAVRAALDAAQERMALGRYTAPAGGSAYDALLAADRAAPSDPRVIAAFDALIAHYSAEAGRGLDRSDYEAFYRAQEIIDRIRTRRPI